MMSTETAAAMAKARAGSGPATTAAIGSVTVPAMRREGYDVPFAAAITASAGALGSLGQADCLGRRIAAGAGDHRYTPGGKGNGLFDNLDIFRV